MVASASLITTTRQADPAMALGEARYRNSAVTLAALEDRRYLDNQVRGCQIHLADLLINGVVGTYVKVDTGSAALAAGDAVCLLASTLGVRVTLATAAAIATSGAPVGVMLAATAPGADGQMALSGVVPASITGLAATAGYARISSLGRVERVASLGAGDYPIGRIDAQGNLVISTSLVIGGPGAFSYLELGSGTKPSTGLIRVASGAEMLTALTASGSFNNAWLTDTGADVLRVGNSTFAAGILFSVKTGSAFPFQVAGSDVLRITSTSVNIPSGSTYSVNGVAHSTTAVASSLAFRGSAGELSVTRLYGSGTVHATAFLSTSRNLVVVGGKTNGGTDHPFLTEITGDALAYGSTSLTLGHVFRLATSGALTVVVDATERLRVNSVGLTLAAANAVNFGSATVLTAPSGVPTLGTDAGAANIELRAGTGMAVNLRVDGNVVAAAQTGKLNITSGNALAFGGDPILTAPSSVATLGFDASARDVEIRAGAAKALKAFINGAARLALDGTALYVGDYLGAGGGAIQVGTDTFFSETAGTSATLSSANPLTVMSPEIGFSATSMGFFSTSPIAKPTVTGSRGANAALASLLTQLANLGLITDSTS